MASDSRDVLSEFAPRRRCSRTRHALRTRSAYGPMSTLTCANEYPSAVLAMQLHSTAGSSLCVLQVGKSHNCEFAASDAHDLVVVLASLPSARPRRSPGTLTSASVSTMEPPAKILARPGQLTSQGASVWWQPPSRPPPIPSDETVPARSAAEPPAATPVEPAPPSVLLQPRREVPPLQTASAVVTVPPPPPPFMQPAPQREPAPVPTHGASRSFLV